VSPYDAAVVGGGPAGSAAALALARHGLKVALLEREPLPRYKTCGGGVVRRAARLSGLDLGPVVERDCRRVAIHVHNPDHRFLLTRDEPLIRMTMRDRLDYLLVETAVRAGAELLAPCCVTEVTASHRRVRLGTERGTVWADFVVAADGALGDVARLAAWPDDRRLIPALEYEITLDDAAFCRLADEPRFDVGGVPHGYAWVFPKAAHLSVGVLSTRRGARDLRAQLEHYLQHVGIVAPLDVKRHGFVIPVRPRSGPLVRERIVLAGDAAGFADPLTAEGISYAIRSGQLAAEAIAQAAGEEIRVRDCYHAGLRQEILPELRTSRMVAALLYDCAQGRRWLFGRHGQSGIEALAGPLHGDYGYRPAVRQLARQLFDRRRSA
jgi:geranylgeranyl reductase family protein